MTYTVIIKSPNWETVLFVETTKLFVSNCVRVYRYIMKFSDFMSRGWGFWLPVLSRGEGFCTEWLSRGEGFCFLQIVSRGGMVMDEIDTCISLYIQICIEREDHSVRSALSAFAGRHYITWSVLSWWPRLQEDSRKAVTYVDQFSPVT